ncbi:mycothiol transferase [Paeniglutamicibacter sp. R2-26]|uniref:mycothiol transferase n=1 Tax=Paeniglutamicibacter sp. R2-26 TaxID=3144417 RepID=UPI003EE52802
MPQSPPKDHLLLEFSLLKFDEMTRIVAAFDDERAVRPPALPGANTPYGILNHCLGMMRRWSSSVNRGIEVPRDRDAEFTDTGTVRELLERAAVVRGQFVADVRAVDPAAAPASVPEGRAAFWTASTHGVLLHVFEELCQHLGQLEITRDILDRR